MIGKLVRRREQIKVAERRLARSHRLRGVLEGGVQGYGGEIQAPRRGRLPPLQGDAGMGLMALTGRRPAEIFFSASFSLPREKLPYPALLFDNQLKTRQAPGTSSLALPHPGPGRPQETCPGPRHSPDPQKLPFPQGR